MSQTAAPLAGLDRVMGHSHAALKAAKLAAFYAGKGDTEQSQTAAQAAAEESSRAVSTLQMMGGTMPSLPTAAPIPLHLLDTPSSRELLALLRQAVAVAERVDKERGRSVSAALPGDVTGLDLAEVLHDVTCRVADEVEGPARTAGRE